MINKRKVSLVIPCRNEAEGIRRLIRAIPAGLDEIIVVDNNSTDTTKRIVLEEKRAKYILEKRVDKRGIGYGFALIAGLAEARGEYVVTMDGDGTYPPEEIEKALRFTVKEKLDMLVCSRFPLDKEQAISKFRQLGVWILNIESRWLLGYQGSDILSGMLVMRRGILPKLELKEGGWNFSPEVKLNAMSLPRIRVGEWHVPHYQRDWGKSKQVLWQTGLEHFLYILTRTWREKAAEILPIKTEMRELAVEEA